MLLLNASSPFRPFAGLRFSNQAHLVCFRTFARPRINKEAVRQFMHDAATGVSAPEENPWSKAAHLSELYTTSATCHAFYLNVGAELKGRSTLLLEMGPQDEELAAAFVKSCAFILEVDSPNWRGEVRRACAEHTFTKPHNQQKLYQRLVSARDTVDTLRLRNKTAPVRAVPYETTRLGAWQAAGYFYILLDFPA